MKKYMVGVSWSMGTNVVVEASSPAEAISKVKRMESIPENGEFIGDSFLIDDHEDNVSEVQDIQLSDEQLYRIDEIDNAVFDCIKILVEDDNLEWDMSLIGDVADSIKIALHFHNLKVRHPSIVETDDGVQYIKEYSEDSELIGGI